VYYLVQAATFPEAVNNISSVMSTTMIDYVIASVAETQIMDVYEYQAAKKESSPELPEYLEQ
jgi:hypothetical protein